MPSSAPRQAGSSRSPGSWSNHAKREVLSGFDAEGASLDQETMGFWRAGRVDDDESIPPAEQRRLNAEPGVTPATVSRSLEQNNVCFQGARENWKWAEDMVLSAGK
jgi:hypothetical protein